MMLTGVNEQNGWLFSEWHLTYRVGWAQICKAVYALYDSLVNPEILIVNTPVSVKSKQDILSLDEASALMIRGMCNIVHVPVMMTFYNQSNLARAVVAAATEEFQNADYQRFNISMCQLMDSVELAMYRS